MVHKKVELVQQSREEEEKKRVRGGKRDPKRRSGFSNTFMVIIMLGGDTATPSVCILEPQRWTDVFSTRQSHFLNHIVIRLLTGFREIVGSKLGQHCARGSSCYQS